MKIGLIEEEPEKKTNLEVKSRMMRNDLKSDI